MDGVIVDSEKHWKKSELDLYSKLVSRWANEDQQKIIGMGIIDIYGVLVKDYGLSMSQSDFLDKVNEIATIVYMEQSKLSDNFLKVINDLKEKNIPIALASSALDMWINMVLDRFELRPFFDVIVSSEDVGNKGKPEPDIYLLTAKKLNINPKDCIVIEDSKNGVLSAKNAGMYCIGFRNGFNDAQDLSGADEVIDGFQEFDNKLFS